MNSYAGQSRTNNRRPQAQPQGRAQPIQGRRPQNGTATYTDTHEADQDIVDDIQQLETTIVTKYMQQNYPDIEFDSAHFAQFLQNVTESFLTVNITNNGGTAKKVSERKEVPDAERCKAPKKDGQRCTKRKAQGYEYCALHAKDDYQNGQLPGTQKRHIEKAPITRSTVPMPESAPNGRRQLNQVGGRSVAPANTLGARVRQPPAPGLPSREVSRDDATSKDLFTATLDDNNDNGGVQSQASTRPTTSRRGGPTPNTRSQPPTSQARPRHTETPMVQDQPSLPSRRGTNTNRGTTRLPLSQEEPQEELPEDGDEVPDEEVIPEPIQAPLPGRRQVPTGGRGAATRGTVTTPASNNRRVGPRPSSQEPIPLPTSTIRNPTSANTLNDVADFDDSRSKTFTDTGDVEEPDENYDEEGDPEAIDQDLDDESTNLAGAEEDGVDEPMDGDEQVDEQ